MYTEVWILCYEIGSTSVIAYKPKLQGLPITLFDQSTHLKTHNQGLTLTLTYFCPVMAYPWIF